GLTPCSAEARSTTIARDSTRRVRGRRDRLGLFAVAESASLVLITGVITSSWAASAARIASASASHRRVEPSTSVNKNVTTPEGTAAAGADTPAECHIRHAATLHIEGTRPRDTHVVPGTRPAHRPAQGARSEKNWRGEKDARKLRTRRDNRGHATRQPGHGLPSAGRG